MVKRLTVLLALIASAAVLGGCFVIQGVSSDQQDIVGKVRVTVAICASGADDGDAPPDDVEDHPGCFDLGNSGEPAPPPGDIQLLVGLRVPVGITKPDVFSATPGPTPPAAGPMTFRRSPSYEAELQSLVPAPEGTRWIGYVSDTYAFDDGPDETPTQSIPVAIDLGLPPAANGGPYVGPLGIRPVVGMRSVGSGLPAERPVECGDDPFKLWPRGGGFTIPEVICIDSPFPAAVGSNLTFSTRDFGIVGGNATASPGQTVTLPFRVRGAGALPAGLTASLSAATKLPGTKVAVSQASAPLSNGSDTRVTVPVAIPKAAGPGTFEVTVTGRLGNGQTRVGTAKLTVRDRQPPTVTKLRVKPKRFKPATKRKPKRGTKVAFTLSEVATLKVTVQGCTARAGKRKRGRCLSYKTFKGAGTKAAAKGAGSFRFNGRWNGKALKPGPHRLLIVAIDGASNRSEAVRVGFTIRG